MLGVALKDIDLYIHPSEGLAYYGYYPCAGKKIGNGEENSPYGEMCTIRDKVGILLEFTGKDAKLSFYRNGVTFLFTKIHEDERTQ